VVAGVGEWFAAWDAEAALAGLGVTRIPLLYVRPGADLELADLDRLAKLLPALTVGGRPGPRPAAGRPGPAGGDDWAGSLPARTCPCK
jgi:hypothetical protein